ncbi:MAG: hypothetical protein U0871_19770 [Gemmataceae bacterium]
MTHDEKPTYNGWSNYETWAVNLWLSNEEGSYRYWTDRTRELIAECADEDADRSALARLAEELKESVHESCTIEKASLAADLMNAALGEVDWCEIARSMIDETPPDPKLSPLFPLGRVVTTPGALVQLTDDDRRDALARHARGDWGDTGPVDGAENELSLKEGFRLMSVYRTPAGVTFWVITEADRSSTAILLPTEY